MSESLRTRSLCRFQKNLCQVTQLERRNVQFEGELRRMAEREQRKRILVSCRLGGSEISSEEPTCQLDAGPHTR